jgi:TonB family protein
MTRLFRLSLAVATSVFILAAEKAGAGDVDQAPEAIFQEAPVFPYSLRRSGINGEVVVDLVIDTDGNVVKADVTSSTHPDFEAPAVEAALKWKFKPALKNGHPVVARMAVPIDFQLLTVGQPDIINLHRVGGGGGVEAWHMTDRPGKGTPPEFRFDEPPRPILTSAPVYPYDLLIQSVKGKASITFKVDPQGRPHEVTVLSATDPEFGAAAKAMLESWNYEPAKKEGKPCWCYLRKDADFVLSGGEFPVNDSTERLLGVLRKDPTKILKACRLLDSLPKGRFTPSPVVPESVRTANVEAKAVVEFIVDQAGHAQLPRVISASSADFGWAAATAVARWQYTAPLQNGRAVDVRVRVPLVFSPANLPAQAP